MHDFDFQFDWEPEQSPESFLVALRDGSRVLAPGVTIEMVLGGLASVNRLPKLRAVRLQLSVAALGRQSLNAHLAANGGCLVTCKEVSKHTPYGHVAMIGQFEVDNGAAAVTPQRLPSQKCNAVRDLGGTGVDEIFEIDPSARVVEHVSLRAERLVATLLPNPLPQAELASYVAYPVLLDTCLALCSRVSSPEPTRATGFELDALDVLIPAAWPATIELMDGFDLSGRPAVDVLAYTAERQVVFSMRGVRAEAVAIDELSPTVHEEILREKIERTILSAAPALDLRAPGSFASQGVSSLDAMRVLSALYEELGIVLRFSDFAEAPSIEVFIERCMASQPLAQPSEASLWSPTSDAASELSSTQRRFWFLEQLEPGAARYNLQARAHVRGELEPKILARALEHIFERHDVLRSSFEDLDGAPVRRHCDAALPPDITFHDLSTFDRRPRLEALTALMHAVSRQAFDLRKPQLLRITVVRSSTQDHEVFFTAHHIVADGWSLSSFIDEVFVTYDALRRNAVAVTQAPSYAEYVLSERRFLESAQASASREYWRSKLVDTQPLRWAAEIADSECRAPHSVDFELGVELTQKLKALARDEGASLFVVLASVFRCILQRLTKQQDFCLGTAVANRTSRQSARLMGPTINMLALRCDLPEQTTLRSLLRQMRVAVTEALDHQRLPFDEIVSLCASRRSAGDSPLFSASIILEDFPRPRICLDAVDVRVRVDRPDASPEGTSRLDLELAIIEDDGVLRATLTAADGRIAPWLLQSLPSCVQAVARGMLHDLDTSIATVPLNDEPLAAGGTSDLLPTWEDSAPVHTLFERQVDLHPQATAVVCAEGTLSYAQLDARANQLATWLIREGVRPGMPVAILLRRNLDLPVAIFAIMKAGAFYVPCDPRYPRARVEEIVRASGATLVLSHASLWSAPACAGVRVVAVDHESVDAHQLSAARPNLGVDPRALCYAIFTSGSTGAPKGVMIEHHNVTNLVQGMDAWVGVEREQVWLAAASASFDMCIPELLRVPCRGARMVLVDGLWIGSSAHAGEDRLETALRTIALAIEQRVTHMQSTPSMLRVLLGLSEGCSLLAQLQCVLVGGEEFPPGLGRELRAVTAAEIWNVYGPTETTVWSSGGQVDVGAAADGRLAIGAPLRATRLYVIDERGQQIPDGFVGELAIAGAGVARGYLGDQARTDAQFAPDPHVATYVTDRASRMYKTGDLVVRAGERGVVWLGRIDDQIKVRGFRVQLSEIEGALSRCDGVRDGRVVFDDRHGGRLIAYITSSAGSASGESIQKTLAQHLPDYMVPSRIICVDALPLNANGKIDRSRLPKDIGEQPAVTKARRAPISAIESVLVAAFESVLGRSVDVDVDFFAGGGDSLLAVRLVNLLQKRGVEISLRDVFTSSGLRDLAAKCVEGRTLAPEVNLAQRVVLSETFEPKLKALLSRPSGLEAQHVFMTGATGFLGAFLVRELLRMGLHLCCVVRASTNEEAAARLHENLRTYGIEIGAASSRLEILAGDLERPMFGLPLAKYQSIARGCDTVLHNAALVNFVYPYERLEASNVSGTRHVLDFCVEARLKGLHFISTIALALAAASDIEPVSEVSSLDMWQKLEDGYAQSKWVAERIVVAARDRGLPVAIHRPGRIVGDAKHGRVPTSDAITRAVASFIDVSAGFESRTFELHDLVAVDDVALAIATLMTNGVGLGRVWHVTNPSSITMANLYAWIQSFGYRVDEVPYVEWRELIGKRGSNNPFFDLLYYMPKDSPEKKLRKLVSNEATRAALTPSGVGFRRYTERDLHALLSYLVEIDFIPPPPGAHRA